MDVCQKCTQPLNSLSRSKSKKHLCKRCYSAYMRQYYAADPARRAKHAKLRNEWITRNRDYHAKLVRKAKVEREYGTTLERAEEVRLEQQNRCAICGCEFSKKQRALIDHRHSTRTFRGILCSRCNTGLGLFGDSAETLLNAAEYVRLGGLRKG